MKRSRYRVIWIVLAILLIISMSREFAAMARETTMAEAFFGFIFFLLVVFGVIYWIRKSRGGKDRPRKL